VVHRLLNKFAAKWYKRFPTHLNNVSTLPCETWNPYCTHAITELLRKETPDLSHLNSGLYSCQTGIQLITHVGNIAREGVCITDLDLSMTLLTNGCGNDDMIQLGPLHSQSLFQFVQISDACFVTFSCSIPHMP